MDSEKKEAIKKLIDKFIKDHELSEDSKIGFCSDNEEIGVIEHLQTGLPGIDVLTNGGIVKGKVNIIYGSENTCKSTTVLYLIAHQMKSNPDFFAAICDNEKVFDRDYAEQLGIDLSRLIVGAGFKSAEQAYDFCNDMARSGLVDLIAIDTIQALASKAEIQDSKGKLKSTEDNSMALNISALL